MTTACGPAPAMPRLALMFVLGLVMIATPAVAAVLSTVSFERLAQPRAEAAIDWAGAPDPNGVQPFILHAASAEERTTALKCLAEAVYYEAGFQPEEGQRAVAQVVLNRVRDRNFPNSVCGVVYEGAGRRTGCQFTFVCDGSLTRRPPTAEQLFKARVIAEQAIDGYVVSEIGTATHYHTDYVDPYWRKSLDEVTKVGDHIFYSWPGKAGLPAALDAARYAGGEVAAWQTEAKLALSRSA
jgi:spore germination cell wall hydrolase CwlJ-like protein